MPGWLASSRSWNIPQVPDTGDAASAVGMGSADTGTTAAPVVAPAAPAATGTTAVPTTAAAKPIIAPPEAEPAELKDLNTRYEKAANDLTQSIANIKQYDPASAETPEAIRAIKNRIRSFIGPEPDNTKWQGNLNELMAEAKQMMHPTLGNALVQFGLNLMASRSHYFGQAVGEAGVAAMGDREKQQQQGRALWVQAMDMGLKLQGRTDAYNEKLGQMGIQEQRLDQSAGTANYKQQLDLVKQKRLELDKLGTERDKAQTAFNKAFSGSPAGRLVQLNQVRQSMNQPPLTTANATAQEMEYYQFGTKPTAASDKETETTLAVKAAKGDKNAAKALSLLGKGGDADFQSYLNPGAAPTATAAPATAPAGAVAPTTAPTAGAGNAPAAVTGANPLNTPLIQGVNLNRDESVLQNLPPDEAAIVRALASYRLALPARQSLSKPVWQNRMKAAMLYDPSFSQQNYEARQKVLNDYTSGKSAQNIQAFQTLIQHAQRLDQNWAALHNFGGWLTPANTPWNWVLQNVRKDPRFAPLLLDMQAVPEEMMNLWRRVGGTKDEVDRFRAALDINAPPETQQAALKEILELSAGKLSGLKQQYENGMGRPADFHMISPQAEQTFSRHGIRFDDIDPGYAANMGGGAQPPAPTGGGRTTNRENLQRYMTDHPGVTYEQAKKIFQDKGIRVME